MDEKERVLFVCEDNTRAHMAQALLKHHAGDRFEVESAGIWPRAPDPRLRAALRGFGMSDEPLSSQPLEQFQGQHFDFIITLCELAEHEQAALPATRVLLRWHFRSPDAEEEKHAGAFTRCLHEIDERIKMLLLILEKTEFVSPGGHAYAFRAGPPDEQARL